MSDERYEADQSPFFNSPVTAAMTVLDVAAEQTRISCAKLRLIGQLDAHEALHLPAGLFAPVAAASVEKTHLQVTAVVGYSARHLHRHVDHQASGLLTVPADSDHFLQIR